MGEKLAYQIRMDNKLTTCLRVIIKYSDFSVHTKQGRTSYTSADHVIVAKIMELFDKLYSRRQQLRVVGVRFSI